MAKAEEKALQTSGGNNLQTTEDPTFNLMQMVIEKGGDIANLEKLIDLQERVSKAQARKSFYAALSAFQSELPVIEKNGKVQYNNTSFEFAKLEDIAAAIKPLLAKHGLSYRYEQKADQNYLNVICIVTHADGHEERTEMIAPADNSGQKNKIQQIASTISYLRRYTVTGALGIVVGGEDNDGVDADLEEAVYMDIEKFNESFPKYEKLILDRKKTASQLIEFLAKKGAILSPDQQQSLKKVEGAIQ